jgi:MFS family permease
MISKIQDRISQVYRAYPKQFWLMFAGMIISTVGASMVWPFLTIYAKTSLGISTTAVGSLFTINSLAGISAAFLAGPLVDRAGRKWVMAAGLALNGLVYLTFAFADSFAVFALLMALFGFINPLYRVGADAMLADLIAPEARTQAYSLSRLANNVGVAIGPVLGGFIASRSYNLAFLLAALGMITYSLLLMLFARETMPARAGDHVPATAVRSYGYGPVLRDRGFMIFLLLAILGTLPGVVMWILMPVYAKEGFGLSENLYGLIAMTNALMVVIFQVPVTARSHKYAPMLVMALGCTFFALGAGSVSLAAGFWGFWLSFVIMTFGELLLVPTSSSYTANLAPLAMRGRYMSLYGLVWPIAMGVGPLFSGMLGDIFSPQIIWLAALATGLAGAAGFYALWRRAR